MTTIGILGAGQLGRMLALAGYPLGLRFRFLDPHPEAPAGHLAEQLHASLHDLSCLERFAPGLTVATFEFESISVELVRALAAHLPVFPSPDSLERGQDRLLEKTLFQRLGLPTAPFVPVSSRAALEEALKVVGFPAILKTRRFGYDGKGQFRLNGPADVGPAWEALGDVPLLLEALVRFEREVSQIAVRGQNGALVFYPLVENHHHHGILRLSLAPAPGLTAELQQQAADLTRRVLEELNYVGVLTIEFFQQGERLIANEMAPRVHNSGHWTIEGAQTSQFENHLRALLGWPLGSADLVAPCAMLNLIGVLPSTEEMLTFRDVHLHLYGKAPRPGRKIGHVTLRGANPERACPWLEKMNALVRHLSPADALPDTFIHQAERWSGP